MASKQDPRFYVDIARIDEEARKVFGYATTETKDSYGTVIDLERIKSILPEYMRFANIREMHQNSAVGTADEATVDDSGLYLAVSVVDDAAWQKVVSRVYKGFSIGGKKDYQIDDRIFLKNITEISLVDRPSNTDCMIDEYRVYGGNMDNKITRESALADITRYAGEEISDSRTALDALSTIMWLMNWEQAEADEGAHPEAAEQVTSLKAAIENLKKFILSELKEDSTPGSYTPGEMSIMELSAGSNDDVLRFSVAGADGIELEQGQIDRIKLALKPAEQVERSGSRHSTEDMTRLNTIRDTLVDLGVTLCDRCANVEAGAGADDDVQRLHTLESDVTRLESAVTRLEGEKTDLLKRVETLEKEPEMARGALKAVEKGDDVLAAEADLEVKRIEALPPEQQAVEMIKRAHQQPQIIRL